jgi:hypothetical protein
MNRLQMELDRLYGLHAPVDPAGEHGSVRMLVLEVALPAGWTQLAAAWQGVQADLDLPAPAIAVSGIDALQLWFALESPIAADAGVAFLQALCTRYLADVKPALVRRIVDRTDRPTAPPVETSPDRWSAFITPDLASVFAETPWLDVPPPEDGQATLLRSLRPIPQAAFQSALDELGSTPGGASAHPAAAVQAPTMDVGVIEPARADAVRFLHSVMRDDSAPLALRIDAAKAILLSGGSNRP